MDMKYLPLKLGVGVILLFVLVIATWLLWNPVKIRYYVDKYKSCADSRERIKIVDILCDTGEPGKTALYKAFRERCISEQVKIPAGSFMMGSEKMNVMEKPVHKVILSSFNIDKYEVTNEKYYVFVKSTGYKIPIPPPDYLNYKYLNKHWGNGKILEGFEQHPVNWVSWIDAKAYADWLGMRLPTEAEWEYACRAGSTGKYCFGDDENLLDEYVWYYKNAENSTHIIGGKKPNNWGLYDMHGNVREWCLDWYGKDYYTNSPIKDPQGPPCGTSKILRSNAINFL